MFRYLNQVPMCSESEDTAKSIFSGPFGGHLGFMQISYSLDSIRLFICYVADISGTNGAEINYVAICGG